MKINWENTCSHVLLNVRMPENLQAKITQTLLHEAALPGHIWLGTSGTTAASPSDWKYVALAKSALLVSAKAVNEHLQSDSSDIWLNALPFFHVGGLGIYTRSYLSGAQVIDFPKRWNVQEFCQLAEKAQATLTALVPAQVYDLVMHRIQAPKSLRAVVVGGGALRDSLYFQARELGWKLLPSYGLTECCSQVATADHQGPNLKVLPHVEIDITKEGFLKIQSQALLTSYAWITPAGLRLEDPKRDGWLVTEDRGECKSNYLQVLGRDADFVKIGGESTNVVRLQNILEEFADGNTCALLAVADPRLGHVVHLVVEEEMEEGSLKRLLDSYHREVLPFEKVRKVHRVAKIPRSSLGKILRGQLHRALRVTSQ